MNEYEEAMLSQRKKKTIFFSVAMPLSGEGWTGAVFWPLCKCKFIINMLCGGAEFFEFCKMMMVLLWLEWLKSKSYNGEYYFQVCYLCLCHILLTVKL